VITQRLVAESHVRLKQETSLYAQLIHLLPSLPNPVDVLQEWPYYYPIYGLACGRFPRNKELHCAEYFDKNSGLLAT